MIEGTRKRVVMLSVVFFNEGEQRHAKNYLEEAKLKSERYV